MSAVETPWWLGTQYEVLEPIHGACGPGTPHDENGGGETLHASYTPNNGIRIAIANSDIEGALASFDFKPEQARTVGEALIRWAGLAACSGEDPGAASRLASEAAAQESYQARVADALRATFGADALDPYRRVVKFWEEATEIAQAGGLEMDVAIEWVRHVYGEPVGEIGPEAGSVVLLLAGLCEAHGEDMMARGEADLAHVIANLESIRARQAAKPMFVPGAVAPRSPALTAIVEFIAVHDGDTLSRLDRDDKVIATASGSWSQDACITLGDLRALAREARAGRETIDAPPRL